MNGRHAPTDPIELKLARRTYETERLGDAGPDHWGRRVIEKHAGKGQLDELDYLLESPDDRAGAFGFGSGKEPPVLRKKFNKTKSINPITLA